jgi:hypothetical protein
MLERRDVPSTLAGVSVVADIEPNDVITGPQLLGAVDPGHITVVHGTIGNNGAAGADVDWFGFDVGQTEKVTLTLNGSGVVSLYDNDAAVAPLGHQLILQFPAAGPATAHSIDLLPGSYEVAVSGAGNRYFSPILANSGSAGLPGAYVLTLAGAQPDFDTTVPLPIVRTDIPAAGFSGSPLKINVYLSQPIDLTQDYVTILDANQNDLAPDVSLSSDTNDLVLTPEPALPAGHYQIVGFDADFNQILSVPFTVNATATTDTLATAMRLGDITQAGLVQLPGVIGNDPYYSLFNSDPTTNNPASQVNMISFTVSGPGQHVLTAEAFAGRIGSPLNAALTLFRITGTNADGSLAWQLVAGNDNTYNATAGSNGEQPLYSDPALFAALAPGRYVVAVSAMGNYGDPLCSKQQPDVGGVFDPNSSHSGSRGETTGGYVLNLFVQPAATTPPQVVQTSLAPGAVLNGPPTEISVQFSVPMNLVELAVDSGQQERANTAGNLDPVLLERFPLTIQDATGTRYFIALNAYDSQTGVATFTVLDRLSDGQYFLHLSGPNGLTDLAGNALAGDSVSGDYVVPFSVTDSPGLAATTGLTNPDDSFAAPTDLGVLFPDELAGGVVIQRDFSGANPAPQDQADYYRFTLLHDATVALTLGGSGLNVAGRPVLLDAKGNPLYPAVNPNDRTQHTAVALLKAGTYTVMVGSWPTTGAGQVVYTFSIKSISLPENPTPLTSGPAPAYRLQLDTVAPPAAGLSATTAIAPQITLPGQGTPNITLTVDRSAGTGALSSGNAPAGATNGLAAGPVGVVTSPGAASNESIRLVLPGTEFPTNTTVALEGPEVRTDTASAASVFGAVESTLRAILFYTLNWLRVPPLLPPSILQEAPPAPAPSGESEDGLAPPTEPGADARLVDGAAVPAALVLIGHVMRDIDQQKRRSARSGRGRLSGR